MSKYKTPQGKYPPAGFWRRFAAMIYDFLIAGFFISLIIIIIELSISKGEEVPIGSPLANVLTSFWFILSFLYFGWFWTRTGQTIGMKVWKIQAVTNDETIMNWLQALLRYIMAIFSWAIFGLGFLLIFVDKQNKALHDHLSKSKIIKLS
jgi:uncharacterized RDD family membrane protein YckC